MSSFHYNDYDKYVYETELRDFLPDKIMDAHIHVGDDSIRSKKAQRSAGSSWTRLLSKEFSVADFVEASKVLFPHSESSALVFGFCTSEVDLTNALVQRQNKDFGFPTLFRTYYEMTKEELEAGVKAGGFLGLKPYLTMRPPYIPPKEIRIYDFLPKEHLEVADKNGWIVMLHIPRDQRLRDPVNVAQLLEIEKNYPNIKLIVAHVGRAYAKEDFGDAFEILKQTKNMRFDFTANLLDEAMIEGIKCVGVDRFIYGTDLPIAFMRMYRIVEDGVYYNVVPKGLYGDVSGEAHMKEVESDKVTLMVYEQLRAFKRAATALKLSDSDVEKIMYTNIKTLVDSVK